VKIPPSTNLLSLLFCALVYLKRFFFSLPRRVKQTGFLLNVLGSLSSSVLSQFVFRFMSLLWAPSSPRSHFANGGLRFRFGLCFHKDSSDHFLIFPSRFFFSLFFLSASLLCLVLSSVVFFCCFHDPLLRCASRACDVVKLEWLLRGRTPSPIDSLPSARGTGVWPLQDFLWHGLSLSFILTPPRPSGPPPPLLSGSPSTLFAMDKPG